MHWVKATTPDGRPCYLNLAAVPTMMRATDCTMVFLGGLAYDGKGNAQWANTQTRETPDELLALPVIHPGARLAALKPDVVAQITDKPKGRKRA